MGSPSLGTHGGLHMTLCFKASVTTTLQGLRFDGLLRPTRTALEISLASVFATASGLTKGQVEIDLRQPSLLASGVFVVATPVGAADCGLNAPTASDIVDAVKVVPGIDLGREEGVVFGATEPCRHLSDADVEDVRRAVRKCSWHLVVTRSIEQGGSIADLPVSIPLRWP